MIIDFLLIIIQITQLLLTLQEGIHQNIRIESKLDNNFILIFERFLIIYLDFSHFETLTVIFPLMNLFHQNIKISEIVHQN